MCGTAERADEQIANLQEQPCRVQSSDDGALDALRGPARPHRHRTGRVTRSPDPPAAAATAGWRDPGSWPLEGDGKIERNRLFDGQVVASRLRSLVILGRLKALHWRES